MVVKLSSFDSEIQILDEKRQIRNLTNAVRFADSFSLLFVRCNQRSYQEEIIEELKTQLPEYKIKVIFLENQIDHLLDELQKRLTGETLDAVFVYGLENSLPDASEATESKFVVTLNHSRNTFKKVLSCPLVLFLPEYALSAIYHGATDFYSIRSGIYHFSLKAEETEIQISQQVSSDFAETLGLSFDEKQNKIKTIEKLISEYKSLPDLQRNLEKEFSLKTKLADMYSMVGDYDKAESLYKEAIKYFRQSDDLFHLSTCLDGLGEIYKIQKKYKDARSVLTESLELDRKNFGIKHPRYAVSLNNLGTVYGLMKNYPQALELINSSLKINREILGVKSPEYATNLTNLAANYLAQGRYKEAINYFEKALEIGKETIGVNHPDYGVRLSNLSRVYFEIKNYREALKLIEESYKIYLNTLGKNHSYTKDALKGIKLCKAKLQEIAQLIVPFKK